MELLPSPENHVPHDPDHEISYAGNVSIDTGKGVPFTFKEYSDPSAFQEMTFGKRVKQALSDQGFTIPQKLETGGISIDAGLFQRLKLDEYLYRFLANGHGTLAHWSHDTDEVKVKEIFHAGNRIEKHEVVEIAFSNMNPYALMAAFVVAMKENMPKESLRYDIKSIEKIPLVSKYIRQIDNGIGIS